MARTWSREVRSLVLALVGAAVSVACGSSTGSHAAATRAHGVAPAHTITLRIGGPLRVHPIEAGFLGLSLEFPAVPAYVGTNPRALDRVFEELIRNLTPGQEPVLRIGGDSTDGTWWPVPGTARPAGVRYRLTPNWLSVTSSLADALGAKLILGVNLEADSRRVAKAEADAFARWIGAAHIEALEPGNEPELYPSFTWGRSGRKGRPRGYDFGAFTRDFAGIAAGLSPFSIAGPAIGAPGWSPHVPQFVGDEPRLRVVTLHRYPVQLCFIPPGRPNYPTIHHLVWAPASRGLASSVASDVAAAHARGLPVRIDEMNTISCGTDPYVAHSFASALWSIDAILAMASVGVDGVNIHSYPGATYALYRFSDKRGTWRGWVEPQYYGLLMVARAAPPRSRLLHVSGRLPTDVRVWATRARDGTTRVLVMNDGARQRRVIALPAASTSSDATVERLSAPGLSSQSHITLDGQSFVPGTTTGQLDGTQRIDSAAPANGYYVIKLPPASATLVTIP